MTSSYLNNDSSQKHCASTLDKHLYRLPIDEHRQYLLYLLQKNDVLIVAGDTGCGKSTRIPQILLSSGLYNGIPTQESTSRIDHEQCHKQICITQPRRVAAIHLAEQVASDLGCGIGQTVGYVIRFTDKSNPDTMIKYMTQGVIIRELMIDPTLNKYSVIMLDEVHERNIHCDILMGLLRCLLKRRDDLKLIICSATMNIDQIKKFYTPPFNSDASSQKVGVLQIQARQHPVKIYHRMKPVPDYVQATIETIINIHESNRLASGKILAFLTGQDEVELVCEKLGEYSQVSSSKLELKQLVVLPLYASLGADEIERVFKDFGRNVRVCIISTNIAETSLTINGVAFVVDCGFTKLKQFNRTTNMDSLIRVPISKSSARQRAGRAGRTRGGIVYRLYCEDDFNKLDDNTLPEVRRTSLAEPMMLLMSLGIRNPHTFPLITPMPRGNLIAALELLHSLGAIDDGGGLTPNGEMMSQLNLDPKIGKLLIDSTRFQCSREICKICATLQVKDIFLKTNNMFNSLWSTESLSKICVSEGDPISYLNILNSFLAADKSKKWADRRNLNHQALLNASDIAIKLEAQLTKLNLKLLSSDRIDRIQKCLVSGLFANAAYLHPSGDYRTLRDDMTVYIHPTSIFADIVERPKYVLFVEILNTTKPYMRHIMSVEHDWLLEAAPHYYTFATELEMKRTNH